MSVVTEEQVENVARKFHNLYFTELSEEVGSKFNDEDWDTWRGGEQHRNCLRHAIRELASLGVIELKA